MDPRELMEKIMSGELEIPGNTSGLDNLDWSDPNAFIKKYDPQIPIVTAEDLQKEARSRSKRIFAQYDVLQNILDRHEATIQKRWTKKTRQQRQKILLDVWPNMSPARRPDFEAFRHTNRSSVQPGSRALSAKYRDAYMWPYINVEDLVDPRCFLLLLKSRGRNPPPRFAGADSAAMRLGKVSRNLIPVFLNMYTMILHRANNAEEYGKLVSWDDDFEAMEWATSQREYIPGDGLLAIQAQERLMDFLVDCCGKILPDIPWDTLTTDVYPVQEEPLLKSEIEVNGFDSLVSLKREAPYRVPEQLDFGRLAASLGAMQSSAEDHVWALREDPGYFKEELIEVKEHRQEMLKDENGRDHPVTKPGRQGTLWARICGTLAVDAYMKLELYTELHKQALALKVLHDKYKDDLSPETELPQDFLDALLRFQHYLNQAVKGAQMSLKSVVVASPPWRRHFMRMAPPNETTSMISVKSRPSSARSPIESELLWLLRALWEGGDEAFLVGVPLLVDELGRLLETKPAAQTMVSARVDGIIGDLSLLGHCLGQLDLFLPWSRSFEDELVKRHDAIKDEFARRTQQWGQVNTALHETKLQKIASTEIAAQGKFTYPIDKPRTEKNVLELRGAEAELDRFWHALDSVLYRQIGDLGGSAYRNVLSQPRIMRRTPAFVEDQISSPEMKRGKHAIPGEDLPQLYQPLSTIYIGDTPRIDILPPTTKEKTKTKGQRRGNDEPAAIEAPPTTTAPADEPRIAVDARALKVFKTLFFTPAVGASPGEISWSDFLHAMTSSGAFTAEKLYGSVWQFQRLDGEDQSRIQIHEPHPRGKIPFRAARRHGRRLNRHFGWDADSFVLKPKGE